MKSKSNYLHSDVNVSEICLYVTLSFYGFVYLGLSEPSDELELAGIKSMVPTDVIETYIATNLTISQQINDNYKCDRDLTTNRWYV